MAKWVMAGVALTALAACGSPGAVGENSAGSVKTTAVGSVVDAIPSPTPSPTGDDAVAINTTTSDDMAADNMAGE